MNKIINIGKLEHILINPDFVTVRFTNFFNGDKFTQRSLISFLINSSQKRINISYHKSMENKIIKILQKANYDIIQKFESIEDKNYINMEIEKLSDMNKLYKLFNGA